MLELVQVRRIKHDLQPLAVEAMGTAGERLGDANAPITYGFKGAKPLYPVEHRPRACPAGTTSGYTHEISVELRVPPHCHQPYLDTFNVKRVPTRDLSDPRSSVPRPVLRDSKGLQPLEPSLSGEGGFGRVCENWGSNGAQPLKS